MSRQTEALEAAGCIKTGGIQTTRLIGALIHILAADIRVSAKSLRTNAGNLISRCTTLGIRSTAIWLAHILVLGTATLVGITKGTGVTSTTALSQSVLTMSILSTEGRAFGLLDGRHAKKIGVTNKVWLADAFAVVLVAGGTDTTDDTLTAFFAASIDADLSLVAGSGGSALIGAAAAAGEGIT